jgi:hypothetical protein
MNLVNTLKWPQSPRAPAVLLALAVLSLLGCGGGRPSAMLTEIDLSQPRVMTFNAGTPDCNDNSNASYSCADADTAGEWYGTGLAHLALIADVMNFMASQRPAIVALQEVFHPPLCAEIPPEHHAGFICERWQPGDPTVVQEILGQDYQVACHQNRPDKCAAVHKAFGRFQGCSADLCLNGLDGGQSDDCGGGTRVGRGRIVRRDGRVLTLVSVHGTSGITPEDQNCRVEQFEQIFVDLLDGSGQPAVGGPDNLIMGDLNTDPGRFVLLDASAARWNDFVGPSLDFQMVTDVGLLATPTYLNLINIDHIASDRYSGDCFAGVPSEETAFDHQPIVCDVFNSSR